MQVALCFAAADSALAQSLSDYLELNLDLKVELVAISAWLDLLESVETALPADRVIVALTAASLPERLPRERWDALNETRIAWVLVEDCPYPPLLTRRVFFDLRDKKQTGLRAIRYWLMTGRVDRNPDVRFEQLLRDFVDRPAAIVLEDGAVLDIANRYFVVEARVDSRGRTPTSIVAELAEAFDLDRSVDLESLLAAVRRVCFDRRYLIIWKGPDPALIEPVGRSSIVRIPLEDEPAVIAPEEMKRVLIDCQRGRSEPPRRADLDRTLSHVFADAPWPVARELAQFAFAYLKAEYRLAEAYGLLESMQKGGEFYADDALLMECRRELAWIADQWAYGATSGCETSPQLGFDW